MKEYSSRIIKLFQDAQRDHGEDNHLVMVPKPMAKKSVGYSAMKLILN